MEMLVFGHTGLPVLVFPTSRGRFFDAEDNGLTTALAAKIDGGQLQLFCLDCLQAFGVTEPSAGTDTTSSCHRDFVWRAIFNMNGTFWMR